MTTLSLDRKKKKHIDTTEQALIVGKRRRQLREAITGYLLVLPATMATFIFGLWPVIAGLYESVKSGSPITNKYVGLNNYVRQLGSLTYIILFGLCLILLYASYRSWCGAIRRRQELGGVLWYYVPPGLITGAAIIAFAFIVVTRIDGYLWFPVLLLTVALAGFYTADHVQQARAEWNLVAIGATWGILLAIGVVWLGGPALIDELGLGILGWIVLLAALGGLGYLALPRLSEITTGRYISAITMMSTFMLLAVLFGRYTIGQMEKNVEEAQDIATLIFNQHVLHGTVDVMDDDTRVSNLSFEAGQVMVEVRVGAETITAPLAPSVYDELSVERITRLEAAFVNGHKVQVVLPDGTIAEGQLTGIVQGEQLAVEFATDGAQTVREIDIYSALDVGEAVVQSDGYTEPLRKQILATLGVFIGIATVYVMSWVRRHTDDEEHFHLYRWLHYGRVLLALAVLILLFYLVGSMKLSQQAADGMGALSPDQFKRAYEYATGEAPRPTLRPETLKSQLLYWPQVFSIMVGAFLIGVAYQVWQSAQRRETPLGFGGVIFLAVAMMVGGWLLISEIPQAMSLGGRETEEAFDALTRTAMYSVGTVPVQLALGLALAYMLFSEITWGKSLYRVIYFMPYIAPSVATSTVFLVIFRPFPTGLANRALSVFGIESLNWLKEPQGVIRIFYEQFLGGNPVHIPEALAGPSLALTTVILYNIWVFAGYNAVVFLAGLGAIPGELYEAAEVDGAGRWSRFRNITLPLLSPTTFFLSMLSIIGTFKAFSHIYVLRGQATGKEIDTLSVHIFNTLYSANDPGFAAALAFALFGVILILTLVQNRLAREQVFYG